MNQPGLLPEITNSVRAALRSQRVTFWGEDYNVVPALTSEIFGDGAQLIGLCPLNTRPNYYVVRIDSTWSTSNWDTDEPLLWDNLDPILEAIAGEYGRARYDCDCGCHGCGEDCTCGCDCVSHEYYAWPALDDDIGCEWFWLAGAHPSRTVAA